MHGEGLAMAPSNVYYASSASGWDYSSDATGEPDGKYARETNNASQTKYMSTGNFGISSANIPAKAVIKRVTIRSKVYNSGPDMSVGIVGRIGSTDQGTYVTTSNWSVLPIGTVITKAYSSGDLLTLSNLANGTFTVMVRGVLPAGGGTNYCDYVEVTVDYELPMGIEMGCVF